MNFRLREYPINSDDGGPQLTVSTLGNEACMGCMSTILPIVTNNWTYPLPQRESHTYDEVRPLTQTACGLGGDAE